MSHGQMTVERPFRKDSNATEIACAISGGGGGGELIDLSAIECFSHLIAKLSEGKLTSSENDKATIRVKIRPSVFIIETKKEYTLEEISTSSLNELIRKRVNAFRRRSGEGEPTSKRRRDIDNSNRTVVDNAAHNLEMVSGLLPVIINVKKNWSVKDNKEIQIDLKGNQGVEELVNLSHLDASDWERDRLTALVFNSVQGVYYARHDILDVLVTKSHVSGRTLINPIIFRLGDFKVWINTPLQLAFPTIDSKTAAESAGKVLYRHPSLNRLQDLKDMAEKSKSVSSILIPGVSKFTAAELEIISRGGGTLHYFIAQCFFSKKGVSLEDLIARQHMWQNNTTATSVAAPSPVPTASVPSDTAANQRASEETTAILNSHGSDLDVLADCLSNEYKTRHQQRRPQHIPVNNTSTVSLDGKDVSLDASITCFFGPDYYSIADCLAAEDGLAMHILPTSLDSTTVNRALVATHDNNVMEIHNSGRFLHMTYQNAAFVPDVSVDTLKIMLRGTGNASYVGAVVASTLFYNNVNLSLSGGAVSTSGSMNLSDVIVEFFPGDSARLVGEVAGAVASVYRIGGDNNSILFPTASIMAERCSYNRSYRWSDPISCVVGLYTTTMDTFMKKVSRGDPVSRIDADWVNMHTNVLQVVLVPFFDAVFKTEAWVIREVRQLIRGIVENTLLKYTATPEHHTALGFNQALLDIMTQLVVHWAVMQSAAENEGVCKAFPRDPTFVIEPGVSLKNYTLSDTPAFLLNGDNLADKLREVMASPDSSKRSPSEIGGGKTSPRFPSSHARSVSLSVPSARFLKSDKDFPVLITVPDRDEENTSSTDESYSLPPPHTLFLDFSPPQLLLTPNVKYSSEGGFKLLKDKGVLTGKYQIIKESKRQQHRRLNRTADDANSSLVEGEAVEGVRTGFTVDGKIEHISVFLPGSINKSSGPPEQPVNSTKQSKYLIKDMGMETVFFEPLLSSLSLHNAAKEKRVNVKSANFFEECLSPLVRGRIDIFPKKGGSDSAASAGFEWLWKTMQAKKGFTTNINKLMHRTVDLKNITSATNTITTMVANSWSGVYSQLSVACIQLKASAKTPGVSGGGNRRSLPPATATVTWEAKQHQQQQSQATTTTAPAPVVHPPFEPTFLDIQTFLQQHLKNVISTLMARMMMVVSNAELKIIKNVSENVSKIILDSLYVAMKPEKAIRDIIERISFEQNGIFVDLGGGGGDETMQYVMSGSIFVNQNEPGFSDNTTATSSSDNAPVPPHLEAIFERLQSLGSEQPPLPRDASTAATTTTTAAAAAAAIPTSVPPTQQEIINHNTQMKKIRDASNLTSRLLRLIRDDGKKERVDNVITEAKVKYRRTPVYFTAIKPAQPMLTGQCIDIPGNVKPNDLNFSNAHDLYVPVNPRHLLTDMQWLECLSVIESATRDSAQVIHHFKKEATDTTCVKLKELLETWQKFVNSVTDEKLSSSLSSMRIDWFNGEASRIAAIREQAERSRIAIAVQGKIVNLDNFGMVAVARSLIDIDYYVKMPNMWSNRDWRGLVYTAMSIAAIPLAANISRGMMAASQSSVLFDSTSSLYSAEETIRSV